jgi:hypothetical protein
MNEKSVMIACQPQQRRSEEQGTMDIIAQKDFLH